MEQDALMLFELLDGEIMPQLSEGPGGEPRTLDGERYFTLDQAAERFAKTTSWLRARWMATWGQYVPAFAGQPLQSPQAAPGSPLLCPESSVLSPLPLSPAEAIKRQLLRLYQFPGISAQDFEYVLAWCEERRLNAWSGHVYADLRPDGRGGMKLMTHTTINALRAIAAGTGKYRGPTATLWCGEDAQWVDVWRGPGFPYAARCGVHREGFVEPTYSVGRFETFAQWSENARGERVLDRSWESMPDLMLAKCVEALSLRKAFPEIGPVYTNDELGRPAPRTASRSAAAFRPSPAPRAADADPAPAEEPLTVPSTHQGFHLALIDLGYGKPADRETLIRTYRNRFPHLLESDAEAFYAKVLGELRQSRTRPAA